MLCVFATIKNKSGDDGDSLEVGESVVREKETTSRVTKPNKTQTLASKTFFFFLVQQKDAEKFITTHVVDTVAFCCSTNKDTKPTPQNRPSSLRFPERSI